MSEKQEDKRERNTQLRIQEMMRNGWGDIDPQIVERFATNSPAGVMNEWNLRPGSVLSPEQFNLLMNNLRGTGDPGSSNRGYLGAQNLTPEQYLSDPRSAVRLENGQYVYRPELSAQATGGEDFYGINPSGFWNNADLVSMLPLAAIAAGPFATSLGAYGGAAAATGSAEAGASAGAGAAGAAEGGGMLQSLAQAATGTGNLSAAELAALIESGTTGAAGAALESAAGLGTASLGNIAATGLANATGLGGSTVNGATGLLNQLGGSGAAGAASTGASALSKLLGIDQSTSDIIGKLLGAGVGYLGSKEQADALTNLQSQLSGQRAPFLNKAVGYLNNPDSFYTSPEATGAANATMRALSTTYGNPGTSPTAQSLATGALFDRYTNTVNSLGSLGLSGQGIQANLGQQIATTSGQPYAIAGNTISGLTSDNSMSDMMQRLFRQQFSLP